MSLHDPRFLAAARRTYLSLFLMKAFETLHPGEEPLGRAWYLDAMCHALEQVKAGAERRLVITVPPRHLKSVTAAVAYVAWLLGHDPALKIMVATYSQDLARQHAGHFRVLVETDWYKALFPAMRIVDGGNRALEIITTAGGTRKAVSVNGSITGFGADLIIIDDCMKADEVFSQAAREEVKSWFGNTLFTRLNDKQHGRIVSIQQRLHEDDLPAMFLERGYAHLDLPAIAERRQTIMVGRNRVHIREIGDLLNPERESRATLDQIRREIGPVAFAAQYQQNPVAAEGNLLRLEWFGSYEEMPERHRFLKVVQSWDTGMSADPRSDPSVCTTWGFLDRKWYLLDVFRERLDFPDLRQAAIRLHKRWAPDRVLIEDASSGKSLCQDLRVKGPFRARLCTPDQDKVTRLTGCLGEIEQGHFLLPEAAPWLNAFRHELRAFPHGKHDDQVDSLSQFVRHQLLNWSWVMTEYDATGRPKRSNPHQMRPW